VGTLMSLVELLDHSIRARRRSATRVLAGCALPLLAYQTWTLAGWLADGPHQITAYRTPGSTSWYAARIVEGLVLVSMGVLLAHVIRERRRDGRLGVDGALLIGMATASFWDPLYNWITPAWLYSSNFLNVTDWFAHAPGVLNPDAGRMPWPVVIVVIGYPLWGVGFAVLVNQVMSRVHARRPAGRPVVLVAVAFGTAAVLTAAAFTIFEALGLMDAPGYRLPILLNSRPLFFGYSGGLVFGALACLRWFRDDSGHALFERGDASGSAPRTHVRVLAAIAACQLIVIAGWGVLSVPFSRFPKRYPRTATDLINGLCDAPGVIGTRYGPCPGTAGSSLQLR
jgi:hypothetical protein